MNSTVKTAGVLVALQAAMALTCALIASTAFADDQLRTETVKFADLNVNTTEGAQALYTRIHRAAIHVCSYDGADPLMQISAASCARKAEARAIEKLSLPQLTAYYQAKTGKHTQALSASR